MRSWITMMLAAIVTAGCGSSSESLPTSTVIDRNDASGRGIASSSAGDVTCREVHGELVELKEAILGDFDPAAAEKQLGLLEAGIVNSATWPKDAVEGKRLRRDVEDLIASYPAFLPDETLRRLTVLSWNADALVALSQWNSDSNDPESLHSIVEELLTAAPPGHSEEILNGLKERFSQCESSLQQTYHDKVISRAQDALDKGDAAEIVAAWHDLQLLVDNDHDEIRVLGENLRSSVIASEFEARRQQLEQRLSRIEKLDDRVLSQFGVSGVHEETASMKLELFLEALSPSHQPTQEKLAGLSERIDALLHHVRDVQVSLAEADEERRQEQRRTYQRWALQQIKGFNERRHPLMKEEFNKKFKLFGEHKSSVDWPLLAEFDAARILLNEKTRAGIKRSADSTSVEVTTQQQAVIYEAVAGYTGEVIGYSHVNELAFLIERKAAAKYLLPIERALLEPAVQQLYDEAFRHAWESADETGQLELAGETVTVKKKLLSAF